MKKEILEKLYNFIVKYEITIILLIGLISFVYNFYTSSTQLPEFDSLRASVIKANLKSNLDSQEKLSQLEIHQNNIISSVNNSLIEGANKYYTKYHKNPLKFSDFLDKSDPPKEKHTISLTSIGIGCKIISGYNTNKMALKFANMQRTFTLKGSTVLVNKNFNCRGSFTYCNYD